MAKKKLTDGKEKQLLYILANTENKFVRKRISMENEEQKRNQ